MAKKIVTINSKSEVNMLKSAREKGVKIKSCCKSGVCGLCKVRVISGEVSAPSKREIRRLGSDKIKAGYRLSCHTTYKGTVKIEV